VPLDLKCPHCFKPLFLVVRGVADVPPSAVSAWATHEAKPHFYYHCPTHGRFWVDDDGQIHEWHETT